MNPKGSEPLGFLRFAESPQAHNQERKHNMFEIDRIAYAQNVSSWTGLGIKLPKPLAAAVARFEAIHWTEVSHGYVPDISDLTTANAEAKIRELSEHILYTENYPGSLSPMGQAKKRLLDFAARDVLSQAGAAVPDAIKQLTPQFENHAEAYTEAVQRLPEELTAESLIAAGADAVIAYAAAQEHAAYLNRVSDWVGSTSVLPGHGYQVDPVLTILWPNLAQRSALDAAYALPSHRSNPTLDGVDRVLVAAVRNGVEFRINTLAEAAELRSGGVIAGDLPWFEDLRSAA